MRVFDYGLSIKIRGRFYHASPSSIKEAAADFEKLREILQEGYRPIEIVYVYYNGFSIGPLMFHMANGKMYLNYLYRDKTYGDWAGRSFFNEVEELKKLILKQVNYEI